MSRHHWKNGAGRLAGCKLVTDFQFVENAVPAKFNEESTRTSLVVQWLRLCSQCRGTGSFLAGELGIPYAATEDPVYRNRPGIAKLKKKIECSKIGMLVCVSPMPWITFLTITDL